MSLSRALNVRNFLLYDDYDALVQAFDEVHIMTDFMRQETFVHQFQRERVTFHAVPVLKATLSNRLRSRLVDWYGLILFRRYYDKPYTSMFFKGKRFNWPGQPLGRRIFLRAVEWAWDRSPLRSLIAAIRRWLFRPQEFRALVTAIRPNLVMTSYLPHAGELPEEFLTGSAQAAGVPVVSHISGVDNLTLKAPYFCVPDYVIVWNELMKDHAEAMYPSLRGHVFMAPPPQFDIYGQPDKLLQRDALFDALGFSAETRGRSLITFISNGGVNYINPNDELNIFKRLYERLQESEWRDRVTFFVRLSATRREEAWHEMLSRQPNTRTRDVTMAHSNRRATTPWQNESLDATFLQSLVRHSAVVVSACSTLTLDACLCDVPSVSVAFDGFSKPESIVWSMARKPVEDHFLPLTLMGATRFALNEDDLFEHVVNALKDPMRDAAAREKARAYYFAGMIGQPHQDTVAILKQLAAPANARQESFAHA